MLLIFFIIYNFRFFEILNCDHNNYEKRELNGNWQPSSISDYGVEDLGRLEMSETMLVRRNIKIEENSPSHGQFIESMPSTEALEQNKLALINYKTSLQRMSNFCKSYENDDYKTCTKKAFISIPTDYCLNYLQNNGFLTPCTPLEKDMKYRSINGHCNNKKTPNMGQSMTAYGRYSNPNYNDLIWEPNLAKDKSQLASPRLISASFQNGESRESTRLTLAFAYWGQFVLHDLSHTAIHKMVWKDNTIECCDNNGWKLSPRYTHTYCSSIEVNDNDSTYKNKWIHCLNYVRSLLALSPTCTFGPAQQMNLATHYLDASHIYGTTLTESRNLRTFRKGLLKSIRDYLNRSNKPREFCTDPNQYCYLSGDSRVNMNVNTAIMYTLFQREHNRIAKILAKLNSTWSDDFLYEESRRIVIAEVQHITYNEWLLEFLGPGNHSEQFYNDRNDASVSNTFSIVLSVIVNSLMVSELRLHNEKREQYNNVRLKDHYFRNISIIENNDVFNSLIRGMATQHSNQIDLQFTDDVQNNLFSNGAFGFDAFSFDIQRGRDHGLPRYTSTLGSESRDNFKALEAEMDKDMVKKLKTLYKHPDDIDLVVGGLAERIYGQLISGFTFLRILTKQFFRTRDADYYFYTNMHQNHPFTVEQLKEIEKVSFASIMCWNSNNIVQIQSNVFTSMNEHNLRNCSSYPKINFTKFAI